jgi:hypothetical protein
MQCLNCGKELVERKKYCTKQCQMEHHTKKTEIEKPPKYTHCQNPACGKPLEHWLVINGHRRYFRNRMCCDTACRAGWMSATMQGKLGNFALKGNSTKRKYKPIDFSTQMKLQDPLQMSENVLD